MTEFQFPPTRRRLVGASAISLALSMHVGRCFAQVVPAAHAGTASDILPPDGDEAVRPFHIAVPEAALLDLRRRIAATRWPGRELVADQSQGVKLDRIQALVRYWGTEYDWRRAEAALNALPQFVTRIDGVDIQFAQVTSRHSGAMPLLITHGWPGSIFELTKIIGPLTDPTAHGGRAEDTFDLILPSMPGYGFSGKPQDTGWGPDRIARAWDVLMKRLGYGRYVSQGGDWGSVVASAMARQAPAGLLGIHVNMPATVPEDVAKALRSGEAAPAGLTDVEMAAFTSLESLYTKGGGYAAMMVTRPQTVGYALADSPAGQAAWIYDKFAAWTHSGGEPERVLSKDDMLDDITLYWLTNSATSSAQLYWENNTNNFNAVNQRTAEITVPVAVTVFPGEIYRAPRTTTSASGARSPTRPGRGCTSSALTDGSATASWARAAMSSPNGSSNNFSRTPRAGMSPSLSNRSSAKDPRPGRTPAICAPARRISAMRKPRASRRPGASSKTPPRSTGPCLSSA